MRNKGSKFKPIPLSFNSCKAYLKLIVIFYSNPILNIKWANIRYPLRGNSLDVNAYLFIVERASTLLGPTEYRCISTQYSIGLNTTKFILCTLSIYLRQWMRADPRIKIQERSNAVCFVPRLAVTPACLYAPLGDTTGEHIQNSPSFCSFGLNTVLDIITETSENWNFFWEGAWNIFFKMSSYFCDITGIEPEHPDSEIKCVECKTWQVLHAYEGTL